MIISIYISEQSRNTRQMWVSFRCNRGKRAGSCETIRKKFMCAPAARVQACHGSINARAIKIKRGASFLHFSPSCPVQILCKIHEPNRLLIERLRGAEGKDAIIRVRELKLCDREWERKKLDRVTEKRESRKDYEWISSW